MTQDILRARGTAYHQVAGNDVFRRKTELKPYGFYGTLAKFEHNELYPLCTIESVSSCEAPAFERWVCCVLSKTRSHRGACSGPPGTFRGK
jgi:hypothetical protein